MTKYTIRKWNKVKKNLIIYLMGKITYSRVFPLFFSMKQPYDDYWVFYHIMNACLKFVKSIGIQRIREIGQKSHRVGLVQLTQGQALIFNNLREHDA